MLCLTRVDHFFSISTVNIGIWKSFKSNPQPRHFQIKRKLLIFLLIEFLLGLAPKAIIFMTISFKSSENKNSNNIIKYRFQDQKKLCKNQINIVFLYSTKSLPQISDEADYLLCNLKSFNLQSVKLFFYLFYDTISLVVLKK
jgi:hypothetical protein